MDNLRLSTGITTTSTQRSQVGGGNPSKLPVPVSRNDNLTKAPTLPGRLGSPVPKGGQSDIQGFTKLEQEFNDFFGETAQKTSNRKSYSIGRMEDDFNRDLPGDDLNDFGELLIGDDIDGLLDEVVAEHSNSRDRFLEPNKATSKDREVETGFDEELTTDAVRDDEAIDQHVDVSSMPDNGRSRLSSRGEFEHVSLLEENGEGADTFDLDDDIARNNNSPGVRNPNDPKFRIFEEDLRTSELVDFDADQDLDALINETDERHFGGNEVKASELRNRESGIRGDDPLRATGEEKISGIQKLKAKLSEFLSKARVFLDNFKFKFFEAISGRNPPNSSTDAGEARIDRKHNLLDTSKSRPIDLSGPNSLEALASVKWTGDLYKDSKLFARISNQLTKVESHIRVEYSKKLTEVESLQKTLKSHESDELKLKAKIEFNEKKIKELTPPEGQSSDQGAGEVTENSGTSAQSPEMTLEEATKKFREGSNTGKVSQQSLEYFTKEYEKNKQLLEECQQKINDTKLSITNVGIERFEPDTARRALARSLVAQSSQLHLSELSREDLNKLHAKFTEVEHPSKSRFIQEIVLALDNHPVTKSKDELAQMRLDRDEELAVGYVPVFDYKSSKAVENLGKSPEKISLHLREMLKGLSEDGVNDHKAAVTEIIRTTRIEDLEGFDIAQMSEVAEELSKQGRDDRARLLKTFIEVTEFARTDKGATKIFEQTALQGIATQKDPGDFLRLSGNELPIAIKSMLDAHGMKTFGAQVSQLVVQFCKGLINDKDITALKEDLKKAGVKGLSSSDMDPNLAVRIGAVALKFQDEVSKLKLPPEVKTLFEKFSKGFLDRPTVDETTPSIQKGTGLTEKEKDTFIHKLYADQIFLKVIGPAMTKVTQGSSDPEVKSMEGIMGIASVIVQRTASQVGLQKGVVKTEHPPVTNALVETRILLSKKQDEFFIQQGGMRAQATSMKLVILQEMSKSNDSLNEFDQFIGKTNDRLSKSDEFIGKSNDSLSKSDVVVNDPNNPSNDPPVLVNNQN